MPQKTSSRLQVAIASTLAVFIVLCLCNVVDSQFSTLRSRHGIALSQLGSASIAPENLPRSAELALASIAVENHEFPINDLRRSSAWAALTTTLSAYEQRLKLLNAQNVEWDHVLQQRSLWTGCAALGVICLNLALLIASKRLSSIQKC
jgi:hypothetical protein